MDREQRTARIAGTVKRVQQTSRYEYSASGQYCGFGRSGSVLEGFQSLRPHVARIAPARTDRDLVPQQQRQNIFIGRIGGKIIAAFIDGVGNRNLITVFRACAGRLSARNDQRNKVGKDQSAIDFLNVSVQYPVISRRFIAEKSVLSTQKGTDFSLRSK